MPERIAEVGEGNFTKFHRIWRVWEFGRWGDGEKGRKGDFTDWRVLREVATASLHCNTNNATSRRADREKGF